MSEVLDWPIKLWIFWSNFGFFASYDCKSYSGHVDMVESFALSTINQNGCLKFRRYEKQMINGCCWSCDCTLRPWQDFGLKAGVLWHKAVRLKACHRWVGRRIMMQSAMFSMMFFFITDLRKWSNFTFMLSFLKCDDNHQLFAGCCWLKKDHVSNCHPSLWLDYLQRFCWKQLCTGQNTWKQCN